MWANECVQGVCSVGSTLWGQATVTYTQGTSGKYELGSSQFQQSLCYPQGFCPMLTGESYSSSLEHTGGLWGKGLLK